MTIRAAVRTCVCTWPGSLRAAGVTLSLALFACSAPDPMPRAGESAPAARLSDGLLESPLLQLVAEATLRRDAPTLMDFLSHEDPRVRARAAYGLGSVQDPAAVPGLEFLLADADVRVREDAAFALGQIEGGVGEAVVQALAGERNPRVRAALIEAVGKRGGEAALTAVMATDDLDDLPAATLALSRGVIRDEAPAAAVDTLVARMRHDDASVRAAAAYMTARAEAMPRWSPRYRDIADVLADMPRDDEAAMHLLVGLGRAVSVFTDPVSLDWVRVPTDWRIRANAAVAAAAAYESRPRTGEVLVAALNDASPHVRQRAAEALAAAPASEAVREAVLERVRRDPADRPMVGALLPLLARSGEVELIDAYLAVLPAHDRPAWTEALDVLEQLPGPYALPHVARVVGLENAPDPVAVDAALTLREMWGLAREFPEAREPFEDALEPVARAAPVRRTLPLAAVLADSILLDRGSVEVLRDMLTRASGATADSLQRILASAADPRARALVPAAPDEPSQGPAEPVDGSEPTSAVDVEPPRLAVDWAVLSGLGAHPKLVLETEKGRVVLELRTEEAPLTVQTIATLAREGRYDGVPFHRVIPNFVAQGGDVSSGDGTGGAGFVIRSEFTRTPYVRGVLGMASSGKDTEGSQFFVTHSPQWHLDGGYTAFGWVVSGMDVLDRIVRGDRVLSARIVPAP